MISQTSPEACFTKSIMWEDQHDWRVLTLFALMEY